MVQEAKDYTKKQRIAQHACIRSNMIEYILKTFFCVIL